MEGWEQNTEVIWNEDKTEPIGIIVDGEELTMEEYYKKYPLNLKGELKEKMNNNVNIMVQQQQQQSSREDSPGVA